jgi:two-component system chemotaxis response regulator CheV
MSEQGILLESGTNEMELLAVIIEGQVFGINVAKVKSIQQYDPTLVSELPDSPPGIIGIYQNRGESIPFLNFKEILKKPVDESNSKDREIVVFTEFNNSTNCFKVDAVRRIYRLTWSQFTPINKMLANSSSVVGSVRIEDEEILVLDLEQMLSELFPEQIIEEVREEVAEKRGEVKRDGIQILFAEDSMLVRKTMLKALTTAGYIHIKEFENGQLCLDYITANKENLVGGDMPTLLISDIEMPMMDGLTLCNNVKNTLNLKAIHVVMFSSLINEQMIMKCRSVGADQYVTKPESNKLISMLDEFVLLQNQ